MHGSAGRSCWKPNLRQQTHHFIREVYMAGTQQSQRKGLALRTTRAHAISNPISGEASEPRLLRTILHDLRCAALWDLWRRKRKHCAHTRARPTPGICLASLPGGLHLQRCCPAQAGGLSGTRVIPTSAHIRQWIDGSPRHSASVGFPRPP